MGDVWGLPEAFLTPQRPQNRFSAIGEWSWMDFRKSIFWPFLTIFDRFRPPGTPYFGYARPSLGWNGVKYAFLGPLRPLRVISGTSRCPERCLGALKTLWIIVKPFFAAELVSRRIIGEFWPKSGHFWPVWGRFTPMYPPILLPDPPKLFQRTPRVIPNNFQNHSRG